MFSKTNKILKDSRVRFQNKAFRRQLRQAGNFKRVPDRKKNTSPGEFFKVSSFGPLWLKCVTIAVIFFAIYFVYLPNFLSLKRVDISGLNQKQTDTIKFLISKYLAGQRSWPQNNLIILSANKLKAYILANDAEIYQVSEIKKKFPSTLQITAEPRLLTYLVSSSQGNFAVSNDFQLADADNFSTSTITSLIQIKYLGQEQFKSGNMYPNTSQLIAISGLQMLLPEIIQGEIADFKIQNSADPDVTISTKAGWQILLDDTEDLQPTLQKLHLLLNSIDPQDAKRLAYIDMRIINRGYVCLKGTPCATAPQPVFNISTTTTSTLNSIK